MASTEADVVAESLAVPILGMIAVQNLFPGTFESYMVLPETLAQVLPVFHP